MTPIEWFELASYIVTVVGLPFAIAIFFYEQRKERENECEDRSDFARIDQHVDLTGLSDTERR